MNKKISSNIALAVFVLFIATVLIYSAVRNKSQPAGNLSLYVTEDCPHCKIIKDYIEEKNILDKYSVEIKDTGESIKNYNELMLYSTNCGFDLNTVGVPLLYESGNCYMGEDEILDYFIGLTS